MNFQEQQRRPMEGGFRPRFQRRSPSPNMQRSSGVQLHPYEMKQQQQQRRFFRDDNDLGRERPSFRQDREIGGGRNVNFNKFSANNDGRRFPTGRDFVPRPNSNYNNSQGYQAKRFQNGPGRGNFRDSEKRVQPIKPLRDVSNNMMNGVHPSEKENRADNQ
jgi:hypothetical protein